MSGFDSHVDMNVNRPLTAKQDAFAYSVGMLGKSQSNAYRDHYSCATWTGKDITDAASVLALLPKVAARIAHFARKRENAMERQIDVDVKRLMETYIAIAFVDPNELISVRVGCCRYCHGSGGYQWREREYLAACAQAEANKAALPDVMGGFGYRPSAPPNPECEECDGEGYSRLRPMDTTQLSEGARHLYRGAQQTKDGIKILFADKDKALDQIGRMLGAYDDKLRLQMGGAVASFQLGTTDPVEAARAYQVMLASGRLTAPSS